MMSSPKKTRRVIPESVFDRPRDHKSAPVRGSRNPASEDRESLNAVKRPPASTTSCTSRILLRQRLDAPAFSLCRERRGGGGVEAASS